MEYAAIPERVATTSCSAKSHVIGGTIFCGGSGF